MKDYWLLVFARVGVAGLSPKAPGTVGSFVALVLAPVLFMPLPLVGRLILLLVLFWFGVHAATKAEELLKTEDPQEVVIDEFVGQWIVLLPFTTLHLGEFFVAFLLFRLFDIYKPGPIRRYEQLPQGLGIMMDDVAAGVAGMLVLGVLRWIL